jgi:anti-anti-sigma factor
MPCCKGIDSACGGLLFSAGSQLHVRRALSSNTIGQFSPELFAPAGCRELGFCLAATMGEKALSDISAQTWKSSSFTVERVTTKKDETRFRFSGPFTARDMYSALSPDAFREILEPATGDGQAATYIFDLTEVPYMDSHGLGVLVRHHVRCKSNGIQLRLAGVSPRVRELFKLTNMESVFSIAEVE